MPNPLIIFKENIVLKINKEFERFTGYSKDEIIGKSKSEIRNIFKIYNTENIINGQSIYLFIKNDQPREVVISYDINEENEQIYYIKEKRNSRIEDSLPYIENFVQENIGIAIYNAKDGTILKANQALLDFINLPTIKIENIIGHKMYDHPNFSFETIYKKIINDQKPYILKEINTKHHEDKYWDITFIPIFIKRKIKFLLQLVSDITEKVMSRKIIEKQNQELELIIENISEEIIIFDQEGEFLKMNKSARENALFDINNTKNVCGALNCFKGYEIDGTLIPYENRPINRIRRGEKIENYRIIRKNEKTTQYREVSGGPLYNSDGKLIAGILVSKDISDRIKYEENIYTKAQYDIITKIIENFDFGFARLSYPDFKYIDINNKAYELYKKINPNIGSQSSMIGQCISNYNKTNIIKLNEKLIKCFKNNKSYIYVNRHIVDDEELFQKYIVQPLYGLNNEIIEIIVIGIDVTKDEKAINILEKTLQTQDEIYSNVSHELKTPLNVIFSANQIMNMYLTNDLYDREKFLTYNNNIKQNCYRLIKLINNIVDLSKNSSGSFNANFINGNIIETIENIVQSVSEYIKSKGLRITYDANVEEKIMAYDPNHIERIMLNLMSNAIKFSNAGKEIFVNVIDNENTVEICVEDQGIGIAKKHLDSLFKRFYRVNKSLSRNTEGSGIGLSLVKSLVDLHGGTIKVESTSGKGSIFKVTLPAKIIENQVQHKIEMRNEENRIEIINIEFSDIYN